MKSFLNLPNHETHFSRRTSVARALFGNYWHNLISIRNGRNFEGILVEHSLFTVEAREAKIREGRAGAAGNIANQSWGLG